MEELVLVASVAASFGAGAALQSAACRWVGESPPLAVRKFAVACVFGGLWTLLLFRSGPQHNPLPALILLASVLVAAVVDLRTRRIPNVLTGSSLSAVLVLTVFSEPQFVTERLLYAFLVPLALLLVALVRPGGLGMGDVKLSAVIGAGLGVEAPLAILAGSAIVAVYAASIAAGVGVKAARAMRLPLAPFLAAGVGIVLALGG